MPEIKLDECVVIVDDDPDLLQVIVETIDYQGFRVRGAQSTKEAEAILRSDKVFLLILDYRMPVEDGLAFYERIRGDFPLLRTLLLTGFADKEAAIKALQLGFKDLLEKPIGMDRLAEVIRKHQADRKAEIESDALEMERIKGDFIAESRDLLYNIDSLILSLEDAESDVRATVDALYRRIHTMKGASRSIPNPQDIFELTHEWEGLLSQLRDGSRQVSFEMIDVMLRAMDRLGRLLAAVEDPQGVGKLPTDGVVEALRALRTAAVESAPADSVGDNDGIIWVDATPKKESSDGRRAQSAPAGLPPAGSDVDEELDKGVFVSAEKLLDLVEICGEMVVLKNSIDSSVEKLVMKGSQDARAMKPYTQALAEVTGTLQQEVLAIRRVRFERVVHTMHRQIRDLSRAVKKKIRLEIQGGEMELDRSVAKALHQALVHLVRNACDHGLETPADRAAAGKSEEGLVRIVGRREKSRIEVLVEDDGRGISRDRVLAKALENGLVAESEAAALSYEEVCEFLFAPGFSTAKEVTDVSGRGVGLDVVRRMAHELKGEVHVESGAMGTRFRISVPDLETVLVERLMIFQLSEFKLAVPLTNVQTLLKYDPRSVVEYPDRKEIMVSEKLCPLLERDDLFRSVGGCSDASGDEGGRLALVVHNRQRTVALRIDEIETQMDAVVRPLDETTRNVPACRGIALLAGDTMAFVLDAEKVVDLAFGGY